MFKAQTRIQQLQRRYIILVCLMFKQDIDCRGDTAPQLIQHVDKKPTAEEVRVSQHGQQAVKNPTEDEIQHFDVFSGQTKQTKSRLQRRYSVSACSPCRWKL